MSTYKPGSFFLAAAEGWAGYGIALGEALAGSPSRYTHAGIIVAADGTCVEAEPHGARLGNVRAYKHTLISDGPVQQWMSSVAGDDRYLKPAEEYIRDKVVYEARNLLGTPYSALDYFALAALHLHLPSRWIRNRVQSSGHAICSQLVDLGYLRSGIHLYSDGRYPGDVMPSDLAAWAEDWEAGR